MEQMVTCTPSVVYQQQIILDLLYFIVFYYFILCYFNIFRVLWMHRLYLVNKRLTWPYQRTILKKKLCNN